MIFIWGNDFNRFSFENIFLYIFTIEHIEKTLNILFILDIMY